MRKAPINYLITISIYALFWIATGLFLSRVLAENVSLIQMIPDEWRTYYVVFTAIATGLTLIITIIWIIYGSSEKRVEALDKAKAAWRSNFFLTIFICVILFVILMTIYLDEEIEAIYYIVIFIILFFQTTGLYWITTFFFSPTNVEYMPYGK
jgi:hypothetical protein